MNASEVELPIRIERQPDYTTCGPTSLHAVYGYFGDAIPLAEVIAETHRHTSGGTLNVHLALHALRRGYEAAMWVSNVNYWDPTWFAQKTDLVGKLRARFTARGQAREDRALPALAALEEYVERGGQILWEDLSPRRIHGVLERGLPILAGTNGTYLYQCARETAAGPDDVAGDAFGHFVVVCGFRVADESVGIADPLCDNPLNGSQHYRTSIYRLIGAIFLGAMTDDANCLVIRPKDWVGPG
jgi:hypothetical protein